MAECITPFYKDTLLEKNVPHPCGKCYNCVMRRLSGWHFRLTNELKYSTSAHFITLTYDPDFVPVNDDGLMQLNKLDLQNFFKRLRRAVYKYMDSDVRIRYYAVGEYGGRFERPHYHAILFNACPELVDWCWQLGNIHCGDVNSKSIGYTVGYTQKSFYREWEDSRTPPFSCMSKYLGIQYLTPEMYQWHKQDIYNRMYIPLDDGKKIAMPRYFKDLIYGESERKKIILVSASRSDDLSAERQNYLHRMYGERSSEVQVEMHKLLFKKLQNKKEKRKL